MAASGQSLQKRFIFELGLAIKSVIISNINGKKAANYAPILVMNGNSVTSVRTLSLHRIFLFAKKANYRNKTSITFLSFL